jgi:hypothetical protein
MPLCVKDPLILSYIELNDFFTFFLRFFVGSAWIASNALRAEHWWSAFLWFISLVLLPLINPIAWAGPICLLIGISARLSKPKSNSQW